MYRQYEDPNKLQKMLEQAKDELDCALLEDDNDDRIIDLVNEVESLKDRINFAWQDIEYDEENCDCSDDEFYDCFGYYPKAM